VKTKEQSKYCGGGVNGTSPAFFCAFDATNTCFWQPEVKEILWLPIV